jgi:3-oxoacyl-[acyl-carrier protein] reductase
LEVKGGAVFRLEGKTAMITGAASGIGAAVARTFADSGADIVLCWHKEEPHDAEVVAESVRALGRDVILVEGDVADYAAVEGMIRAGQARFGSVDIVVANAGIARDVPFRELDDRAWHEILDVDLLGVLHCFRAALPGMREKRWGRLLATGSISGSLLGWERHAHYVAAKAAIVGLVRTVALEVARQGVTANLIAPGVVETPMSSDPVNSLGVEGLRDSAATIPVGRVGTPEDVAAAFLYLASEEASWVTGQTIVVDGGSSVAYI